ncbi:FtsZ-localized protein A [uncultured Gammaproteobacteria bacterium]
MRQLYHYPIFPLSRQVRVALAEKRLEFESVIEKPWERREDFLALNPAGEVPVLVETDGTTIVGDAILDYLEEAYPEQPLMPRGAVARAEVRRLLSWFNRKFDREVTENLAGERLVKRLSGEGYPFAPAIRAGVNNVHFHLEYIAWLSDRRIWLAGEQLTLVDIAAGAHLSVVDYIDGVPWSQHQEAKDWYARIKCRPSFRPLLLDRVPGVNPPAHYDDLDF